MANNINIYIGPQPPAPPPNHSQWLGKVIIWAIESLGRMVVYVVKSATKQPSQSTNAKKITHHHQEPSVSHTTTTDKRLYDEL